MLSYKKWGRNWGIVVALIIIIFPAPLIIGQAAAPTVSELSIYKGALATNWINWSWGSDVNLSSTSQVNVNGHSLAFNPTSPWAGLYLHSETPINTLPFSSVRLTVLATEAKEQFTLALYDSNNQFLKSPVSLGKYGGDPIGTALVEMEAQIEMIEQLHKFAIAFRDRRITLKEFLKGPTAFMQQQNLVDEELLLELLTRY